MDTTNRDTESLCPSARPEMEDALVFGVVGGRAREPRLAHLSVYADDGSQSRHETRNTMGKQHNPDAISPSLEAERRQRAGELTAEEQAQLRAMQTQSHDVAGMMTWPSRDTVQEVTLSSTPAAQE